MTKNKQEKTDDMALFIGIKDSNMSDIMDEYCKDVKLSSQMIGYHNGFIIGASNSNESVVASLRALNQTYFFAGIYYANKHKKDVTYEFRKQDDVKDKKKSPAKDYFG